VLVVTLDLPGGVGKNAAVLIHLMNGLKQFLAWLGSLGGLLTVVVQADLDTFVLS
jgi:hypothetical protein